MIGHASRPSCGSTAAADAAATGTGPTGSAARATAPSHRPGFSLVEVVIALLILTVGVLAMAASTGYVTIQLRVADLNTERAAAFRDAVERLRTMPFDDVLPKSYADADSVGDFTVWWDTVAGTNYNYKAVRIYTEGPGYDGGWKPAIQDTLSTSITRPYPVRRLP